MSQNSIFISTPKGLISSFVRNRQLIFQLVKRDILSRYKGSGFGITWSVLNPMLMLAVYTFFFSVVFKARWSEADGKGSFAIILFVGLIAHGFFAEVFNRSPTIILSNVNYIKKVVFPIEILIWVAIGSALFNMTISLIILLIAQIILNQSIPITALYFPIIIIPLILVTLGLAWFLSALAVYARDIGQMTGVVTSVLMFMSPIFYPVSALSPKYQVWMQVNPLTFIIEESRNALIFGVAPSWDRWLVSFIVGCVIAWLGFWWFQKTRKGFADVL